MPRKLFGLTTDTSLNGSDRFAFGTSGTPAKNIQYSDFVTLLNNALGFLKKTSNLSDLPNKTTARTNLGVYSTSEINASLAAKTDIYPATGGALKTNNATEYSPTSNYHPATKKYVDDNTLTPLFKGYTDLGDISSGVDRRTVSLGVTLSTSNYMVVCNLRDLATGGSTLIQDITWGTYDHGTTSFKLSMKEDSGQVQNLRLFFMIFDVSGFTSCSNS